MTVEEARGPVPSLVDAGHAGGLTGPAVFRAGVRVRQHTAVEIGGCRYPVSPVSAGFVALRARRAADLDLARQVLGLGRPLALTGDPAALPQPAVAGLAAHTGSRWSHHDGVHFMMPGSFIRERVTAIRRRQSGRAAAHGPWQEVTAVAVVPGLPAVRAESAAALRQAGAVVATDWTFDNTLPLAGLDTAAPRHVVRYDINDYDTTIAGFNDTLNRLQEDGFGNVALLVEGNPDTLDVLDGVCLARRRLHVVPGVPIAVAAAGEFARDLPRDPFARGLAYLSGLPGRHDQTPAQLITELYCYLRAGISCVLVEMTFGDLDAVLRTTARARGAHGVPKQVALLSDVYSPAARTLLADAGSPRAARELLDRARGTLSTLLVFDAP